MPTKEATKEKETATKAPAAPNPVTYPWLFPVPGTFSQEQIDYIIRLIDARLQYHLDND
mgnify:CR=1 FL=1